MWWSACVWIRVGVGYDFVMCGRLIFLVFLQWVRVMLWACMMCHSVVSLLGLGIEIILAIFHVWGIVFVLSERLNIDVRYDSAVSPRCLRCLMFMLSGPVELLFLACLIASEVCSIAICMGVDFSLLVNLSIILYVLCVVCLMWFVNCLLKFSAFCLSVIAVLLSMVIEMFGVCGGFFVW